MPRSPHTVDIKPVARVRGSVTAMWFEGRGGGTDNPMIWVHAGPSGAHPMGFHVTQEVWEYVEEHGLDLAYERRYVQRQLDAIKALLDNPPARA